MIMKKFNATYCMGHGPDFLLDSRTIGFHAESDRIAVGLAHIFPKRIKQQPRTYDLFGIQTEDGNYIDLKKDWKYSEGEIEEAFCNGSFCLDPLED